MPDPECPVCGANIRGEVIPTRTNDRGEMVGGGGLRYPPRCHNCMPLLIAANRIDAARRQEERAWKDLWRAWVHREGVLRRNRANPRECLINPPDDHEEMLWAIKRGDL